ncbi:hypothetical protein GCM10010260_43930 [Streptomyces filipinensis]|uniref:Uncharacterized protein n=1 Tax=Streptomyces filipinensis TaxID=66887 RepID=A0A918ID30_9ACTN|nr:hypothetical protein GCM10010260_43930 [Streptomyces filipinensis]
MADLVHPVRTQLRPLSLGCVSAAQAGGEQMYGGRWASHTGVNARGVIHRWSFFFPMWKTAVDNSVDSPGQRCPQGPQRCRGGADEGYYEGYFHCVETPKPAAMKPNPITMFQLSSASMGKEPSVT